MLVGAATELARASMKRSSVLPPGAATELAGDVMKSSPTLPPGAATELAGAAMKRSSALPPGAATELAGDVMKSSPTLPPGAATELAGAAMERSLALPPGAATELARATMERLPALLLALQRRAVMKRVGAPSRRCNGARQIYDGALAGAPPGATTESCNEARRRSLPALQRSSQWRSQSCDAAPDAAMEQSSVLL
ncbi:hypothetical protein VPH35_007010 [Triticum aestivum]